MRPGLLRGARAADAVALAALAAVLLAGGGVGGRRRSRWPRSASDPSVAGPALAYEAAAGRAVRRGERRAYASCPEPTRRSAAPGRRRSATAGSRSYERTSGEQRGAVAAAGADAAAISRRWLAVRIRDGRRDAIAVAPLSGSGAPGKLRRLAGGPPSAALSRPALSGSTSSSPRASRRAARSCARGFAARSLAPRFVGCARRARSRSPAPSIAGSRIAYVETSRERQTVRVTRGAAAATSSCVAARARRPCGRRRSRRTAST